MPASREEVYAAIDTERNYQDAMWPDPSNHDRPNQMDIGSFILLMEAYLADAREHFRRERAPEMNTLHCIRKVAGIAVNCMEQHDAPPREVKLVEYDNE